MLSLTWSCVLCFFFVLLTINKILNPFSLAAEFVRFLVRFSPVGTDIFVCAVCVHFSQKALGHPCQRDKIAS